MRRPSYYKRLAAESTDSSPDPSTEAAILMKGPLADVYAQALQIEYDKNQENNGGDNSTITKVATESQAVDTAIMQKLAELVAPNNAPPTDSFQTVYGVSKNQLSSQTVVDVTHELDENEANNQDRDFILIVDGTQPGPNGDCSGVPAERLEFLNSALESLVHAYGGKVFTSLEEYAKSL